MTGKIKTHNLTKGSRLVAVRWEDFRPSLCFVTVDKINTSSIYLDGSKMERSMFERNGFEKDAEEAIYFAYGCIFNLRSYQLRDHLSKSLGGISIHSDIEEVYSQDKEFEVSKSILAVQSTRRLRIVAITRLQRLEAELLKRKILKNTF